VSSLRDCKKTGNFRQFISQNNSASKKDLALFVSMSETARFRLSKPLSFDRRNRTVSIIETVQFRLSKQFSSEHRYRAVVNVATVQ
jgi:hypothetical protein